jgi:hypothetical protein
VNAVAIFGWITRAQIANDIVVDCTKQSTPEVGYVHANLLQIMGQELEAKQLLFGPANDKSKATTLASVVFEWARGVLHGRRSMLSFGRLGDRMVGGLGRSDLLVS